MTERNFQNDPVRSAASTPGVERNPVLVAAAWLVVGVPLAWGVAQTIRTSMRLFEHPAATASVPTAAGPTTQPYPEREPSGLPKLVK